MNKKTLTFFAILFASFLILSACAENNSSEGNFNNNSDGDTTTLRLAEDQPEDYPTTIGDEKFAELVEEKTDGRYEIEVYPDSQLGEEAEVLEQVQLGSIDLARVNGVPLSEFSDDIGVLSMPFLFEDEETKWDKLNGEEGEELLDTLDGSGLKGFAFYDSGERNFYSTKEPIETVDDMEGLKVRVQDSELAINIAEELGASATPMDYGEVYESLQNGVIDGAENNFPSYYTDSHYEVAEYFSTIEYQGVPEVLLGAEELWNDLSEEDQEAFEEAAQESVSTQRDAWAELVEESKEAVKDEGAEITEIEDIGPWREAVQPIYDEHEDEFGEWVEKFQD